MEQLAVILLLCLFIALANKATRGDLFAGIGYDFQLLLTKNGRRTLRENRRFLHFHITGFICSAMTSIFFLIDNFIDACFFDKVMLALSISFFGMFLNLVREMYYEEKSAADFDGRDIRFGFYGGLIYSIITIILITYIVNFFSR